MTTSKQQLLNMLGLARRAGQITAGEGLVLKSIRAHQARVVFLACDAGKSTVKQFINKCQYYQIPLITMFTKAELSQAIGQNKYGQGTENQSSQAITGGHNHQRHG